MVSACEVIDARGAAEFGGDDDECFFEHTSLGQIIQQRGHGLIEGRAKQLAQAVRVFAMRVPVTVLDADEPATRLDHSPSQQAALTDAGHAVFFAHRFGLARHVEGFFRLLRSHQADGLLVELVEGLDLAARPFGSGLELVERLQRVLTTTVSNVGHRSRQRDVSYGELRRGRVGLDRERSVARAEKRRTAAVQEIRQRNVRRQGSRLAKLRDHRPDAGVIVVVLVVAVEITGSWRFARHHRVEAAAVVRVWMREASQDRKLVGDLSSPGNDVTQLNARHRRADRIEVASNALRSIRFQIPHVLVRHSSNDKKEDAVDVFPRFLVLRRSDLLKVQNLRHAQPGDRAQFQHLASRQIHNISPWVRLCLTKSCFQFQNSGANATPSGGAWPTE